MLHSRSTSVLFRAAALLVLTACGGDSTRSDPNPEPVISAVTPAEILRGSAVEAITVTGSGFVRASTIRLNGSDRPTEYRSGTQLRVTPTEADLADPGAIRVTAHNPHPGGGMSNAVDVNVYAPIVALGETVAEDVTGAQEGVRQFRITGTAGDEWIAFLHAEWLLDLTVVDSATGQTVGSVRVTGSLETEALEARSSGRFVLPTTGTYLVLVGYGIGSKYRFRIDAVDRAPEEGAASMVLGEAAAGTIGYVGDVDEYTFSGAAGQEMNLLVRLESGLSGGLLVELLHGSAVLGKVQRTTPTASIDDLGTGRLRLPADGEYRVRVSGQSSGSPAAATGRYALELYPVDRRPETGGTVRLDGPPVDEAIERPGDVDEFAVAGTAGQQVVIHLQARATAGGPLVAELIDGDGTVVVATDGAHQGGAVHSARRVLPRTGTYLLRVRGERTTFPMRGSYSVELYTISPDPEHVPGMLEIGRTMAGERVDRPRDVDVFTFAGEAGKEVNVFIGSEREGIQMGMRIPAWGDFTTNFAYSSGAGLEGASTGRMEMTEGTYTIIVDSHLVGSYSLLVFPIDRRPEGRSGAYVLGDTVSNEPLYPAGDVDEYGFSLDEEATLDFFWENHGTAGPFLVSPALYDEASGRLVPGSGQRVITLPAGRYRLEILNPNAVAGQNYGMARIPTLRYRFALTPK